ncbi:MAG: hypothetical protein H0U64_13215 [Gemmatimonadaceae bacterium]|nr:hypothetical protein [Gemmatimonadaceae bacterium]
MSRIRSIKPEWLDDEMMAMASPEARVLSVALILLADDYGNGRAGAPLLSGRVFPGKSIEVVTRSLIELVSFRYVRLYDLDGQRYFSIRKWAEHQRVDKPGVPKVPGPPTAYSADITLETESQEIHENLPDSDENDSGTFPTTRASSPSLFSLSALPDQPKKSGSPQARAGARSKHQANEAVPQLMAGDWAPSSAQVSALAEKFSVPEARILALVPEFRVYWRETRAKARKTLRGWSQAFGQNVDRLALRGTLFVGVVQSTPSGTPADAAARAKRAAEVEARAAAGRSS